MLILSFAWLIAASILILRALRQRTVFREIGKPLPETVPALPLKIIVPARNEGASIECCLDSLLNQNYPPELFQIIAVDDNSTDETAELIAKFACPGRVKMIRAPVLPPGWTGKSHACWVAAGAAANECEWLCFTDADIEAAPDLIPAALALAVSEKIDFLSLTPRQRLVSFAERLVMPCGFYLLAFSQNLARINSPTSKDVTATGQFILIRSAAYKAIGGHKAVREDICEDVALARLAKNLGYKTALYGGSALYSTRMYTGWETLWPGITKNLNAMLGGPCRTLATAAIALALAWAAPLLPIVGAAQCDRSSVGCIALAVAAPASVAAFGLHLLGTAFFRIPFWYGFIFPLGYTVGVALAIDSVRRRLTGKIRWKGRTYS